MILRRTKSLIYRGEECGKKIIVRLGLGKGKWAGWAHFHRAALCKILGSLLDYAGPVKENIDFPQENTNQNLHLGTFICITFIFEWGKNLGRIHSLGLIKGRNMSIAI